MVGGQRRVARTSVRIRCEVRVPFFQLSVTNSLALIVGSSNIVKPDVTIGAIIPSFIYLASWSVLAGLAYWFIGFETKGRSIEEIDRGLAAGTGVLPAAPAVEARRPA